MTLFNETPYLGQARTVHVFDATATSLTTLREHHSGNGSIRQQSPATSPGGAIILSGTDRQISRLEFPIDFGNTRGSLRAWSVEVLGLESDANTARGVFRMDIRRRTSPNVRTGLWWYDTGAVLTSWTNGANDTANLKHGNFNTLQKTDAGILTDYHTETVDGHFGGVYGSIDEVDPRGVFHALVELTASDTPTEIRFRQARLTLIWGVQGDETVKVY